MRIREGGVWGGGTGGGISGKLCRTLSYLRTLGGILMISIHSTQVRMHGPPPLARPTTPPPNPFSTPRPSPLLVRGGARTLRAISISKSHLRKNSRERKVKQSKGSAEKDLD